MYKFLKIALAAALAGVFTADAFAGERFGIGSRATKEQIAGWDIDIRPDGQGLPPGKGGVEKGEEVYLEQCASCHGEFGEGAGRFPVLVGGFDTLNTHDPVKTIGSYWPYASTVFDYIKRAMPFGAAQTLSDDEIYAITAYLLYSNDVIEEDVVLDAKTLKAVKMPNEANFIDDPRPEEITKKTPCMKDCKASVEIKSYARKIGVTPDLKTEADQTN